MSIIPFKPALFSIASFITLTFSIPLIDKEVPNETLYINEVSYSFHNNSLTIYYLELINNTTETISTETVTLKMQSPTNTKTLDIENFIILREGYLLISFKEDSYPLPNYVFTSYTTTSSLTIEIGKQVNDDWITYDYISLAISENDSNAINIAEGTNISYHRKRDITGQLINTGSSKNDFELGSPTPTNSALGVALYIMAEDVVGQSVVKYPIAKNMLLSLTPEQFEFFRTDNSDFMKETRKRYQNWANGRGDPDPYGEGLTAPKSISKKEALLLGALIVGTVSLGGFFFFKKKSHQ